MASRLNAKTQRSHRRERGVALFVVIWIGLLISAIVVSFSRDTQTGVKIAQNMTDQVIAEQAARSAMNWASLVLAGQATKADFRALTGKPVQGLRPILPDRPIALYGGTYGVQMNGLDVEIVFQAESGKYDLNQGDAGLLLPILRLARVRDAETIASDILSARTADGRIRGISWRLSDNGIGDISALPTLTSIDAQSFERLKPLVTVRSEAKAPDPATAPDALFAILPMDDDTRARYLAVRRNPAPIGSDVSYVSVAATATHPSGARATTKAMLRISPDSRPVLKVTAGH